MPFGPTGAPSCYARFMQMVMSKLGSPYVFCYLDDVLLATGDMDIHLVEMEKVLRAHSEAGIKLRMKKTKLFRNEIDYLGFHISGDGIHMKKDYIENILNWKTPTSTKELRSFLGFASYYREFIPEFSPLTNEMNSIRSKKTFEWTDTMEQKFRQLKEKFASAPIRAYPRYGPEEEKFQLALDFSGDNVAAILSQVQDGEERLIAAKGRKTTKYEKLYPSTLFCTGSDILSQYYDIVLSLSTPIIEHSLICII